MPLQNGTDGDDFQFFNIVTEAAQSANLGAGRDVAFIRGSNADGGDHNITGGQRNDVLVSDVGGANGADDGGVGMTSAAFIGGDGNDYFQGGSGDDFADGGRGNDRLYGGAGNDSLLGGDGVDTLVGEEGDDKLNGGAGDDFIFGREGRDTAFIDLVTDGADRVDLGTGEDFAFIRTGGAGQIRLTFTSSRVGDGSARDVRGDIGSDGLEAVRIQRKDSTTGGLIGSVARFDDEGITFISDTAGATFEVLDPASGFPLRALFGIVRLGTQAGETLNSIDPFRRHYINAGAGDDNITGGMMSDRLVGGSGNDEIRGLDAGDTVVAGDGDDYVEGGEGSDFLVGDDGNDRLYGGAGDDVLYGDSGNDFLVGETGDDTFFGGLGADIVLGGEGNDTMNFAPWDDGFQRVDLGVGNDSVRVASAANTQYRLTFTSSEVGNGSASDSNTMANQNGGFAVRFQAEDGSGALMGVESQFDDEGIDFILDAPGATFDVRDTVFGIERGNQFRIVRLGTSGGETLDSFRLNESYYINGGAGDDVVNGGNVDDFLVGGTGNDTMFGGFGNDTLLGGAGDDRLEGGFGADVFTGGTGADTYIFSTAFEGVDTITDYSITDDTLSFRAASFGMSVGGPARFVSGSNPQAAGTQATFLYNTTTGELSFDSDGTGSAAASSLVFLTGAPAITAAELTFF